MLVKKLLIPCCLAAVLCFPDVSRAGSPMTHLDLSFADAPEGELSATGSAPWRMSDAEEGAFRPVVVKGEDGVVALHVKSNTKGSISFSSRTNATYQTASLNAEPGGTIEWSFDWKIPEGGSSEQLTLIRLDDGTAAAGHYLAGLGLTKRGLAHLVEPNFEPVSKQMVLFPKGSVSTVPGKWYQTTFRLELSDSGEVTSTVTIQEKGEFAPLYTDSATFTPGSLNPKGVVRILISVTEETDLFVANLRLRSL